MAHRYLPNSIRILKKLSYFAKSSDFKIKMAHMPPIRFYRHRIFRVIADLTVKLTEVALNAATSFEAVHLQIAIDPKMVKVNVVQN